MCANSQARAAKRSGASTSLTTPHRCASAASIHRPVSSISIAMWWARRFGSFTAAASAKVPARISGSAKLALAEASIRSHDSANSQPPPTAMPFTAAMRGLFSAGNSWMPPKPPTP